MTCGVGVWKSWRDDKIVEWEHTVTTSNNPIRNEQTRTLFSGYIYCKHPTLQRTWLGLGFLLLPFYSNLR